MHPQVDNALQFRLIRINEIADFFVAEINDREKLRKDTQLC